MSEFYIDWQMARGRFNHDWLKNRYLPALESFRNVLCGKVRRVDAGREFWEIDFPQWEAHRGDAADLIRGFEVCMSPRILLDESPLCGCDGETKQWVGDVAHTLWSARLSVAELKKNAEACLKTADVAYAKLKSCTGANPVVDRDHGLLQKFDEFRNACHALAQAFERFPSRVWVA